jgi:hypothetical protein
MGGAYRLGPMSRNKRIQHCREEDLSRIVVTAMRWAKPENIRGLNIL